MHGLGKGWNGSGRFLDSYAWLGNKLEWFRGFLDSYAWCGRFLDSYAQVGMFQEGFLILMHGLGTGWNGSGRFLNSYAWFGNRLERLREVSRFIFMVWKVSRFLCMVWEKVGIVQEGFSNLETYLEVIYMDWKAGVTCTVLAWFGVCHKPSLDPPL